MQCLDIIREYFKITNYNLAVMLKSIACGNGYFYNKLNLMKGESVLC